MRAIIIILALCLAACGGGGDASLTEPKEIHVKFTDRKWNVPTEGTRIIAPRRILEVRLGESLKNWGIRVEGNTIELTCMYIPLDAHHAEIPSPAEMWLTLE